MSYEGPMDLVECAKDCLDILHSLRDSQDMLIEQLLMSASNDDSSVTDEETLKVWELLESLDKLRRDAAELLAAYGYHRSVDMFNVRTPNTSTLE